MDVALLRWIPANGVQKPPLSLPALAELGSALSLDRWPAAATQKNIMSSSDYIPAAATAAFATHRGKQTRCHGNRRHHGDSKHPEPAGEKKRKTKEKNICPAVRLSAPETQLADGAAGATRQQSVQWGANRQEWALNCRPFCGPAARSLASHYLR